MTQLAGKHALITGASRGIGAAIATGFAEAGADVVLVARDESRLEKVASEIQAMGRRAVVLPCDVTDRDAVHAIAQAAIKALGHLDVVINNAGGMPFAAPLVNTRFTGWERVMRLNLDSTVHVCQALAPHLLARGNGSVVNMSSVAAFIGSPNFSPYAAAKAAVASLTRTLALEWAPYGVRVNALCPGWTATDLNEELWGDPDRNAEILEEIPMGRWAKPEEMVGPAVFLASAASSFMTGQTLVVDGGQTAR
jgi:NAD(P)-dependent dehydrogenase (short-subunit alcohol dehydrogenase family)